MSPLDLASASVADASADGYTTAVYTAPQSEGTSSPRRRDPAAWALDPSPFRNSALPHPLDCLRHHPLRDPKWIPRRDITGAASLIERRPVESWGKATFFAAPDAGAVRIGMTWRRWSVTSTTFSRKAGRTMYFEGPHEPVSFWLREISHTCTDLQFQPLGMRWVTEDGVSREYYPDSAEETDTGEIIFRENKAHPAYFDDPEIADKLAAAEAALTLYPGVRFERELGTDLMHPVRWRLIKDIFNDRNVAFDVRQSDAARAVIERAGGVAPLGQVWEAISTDKARARRIGHAMLVARVIGFGVDRRPTADSEVVLPRPPARPGRLRSFLATFAPDQKQ